MMSVSFKKTLNGNYDSSNATDIVGHPGPLMSDNFDGSTDCWAWNQGSEPDDMVGIFVFATSYKGGSLDVSSDGSLFNVYGYHLDYSGATGKAHFRTADLGDELIGGNANDVLDSNGGDDLLNGKAGADEMEGGTGDDHYYVDNVGDEIIEYGDVTRALLDAESSGNDTVSASINYVLGDHVENLILLKSAETGRGNSVDNEITGNASANHLFGEGGSDTILGLGGADRIDGGDGDDILNGGAGRDRIDATIGADTLVFDDGDSAASRNDADLIVGFRGWSGDRLDLDAIDANRNRGRDQDFSFIGSDSFHGVAGELRYEKVGSETFLFGDTDGDMKADFTLHFDHIVSFKDEFILG